LEKSVSQKSRKLSLNILVGQILKYIIWRLQLEVQKFWNFQGS